MAEKLSTEDLQKLARQALTSIRLLRQPMLCTESAEYRIANAQALTQRH